MEYGEFLERVISEGIEAAKADYAQPRDKPRLEGSIAGFERCRGAQPRTLDVLLTEAREATAASFRAQQDPENYWYLRCVEAEIEWVCNVVSCLLMLMKAPTIVPPTALALFKVNEILTQK